MRHSPLLLLLAFAPSIACSDYGFHGEGKRTVGEDSGEPVEGQPDPPGAPEISVSPEEVDLGSLCSIGASEVQISNEGDADLTIHDIQLVGTGWITNLDPFPWIIPPGESRLVGLEGSNGNATLQVSSDDSDEGLVEVPLSVSENLGPSVSFISPTAGEIIGIGAASTLSVRVSDPDEDLTGLSVRWFSDVDGDLGSSTPDASGLATLPWDGAAQTPGNHQLRVEVVDRCEVPAEASQPICQNAGYSAENLDLTTWNFEGTAQWDATNSWVQLTGPGINEAGTAFQTSATVDAHAITIEFSFFVSGGSGADGISLTALDSTRMSGFVGGTGGGIGYAGLPGWSVEVDTWYNGEHYDPTTEDHLSVHIDGNVNSPQAWAALPEMEDGAWHTMQVSVSGTWMRVSIDGTPYIDQNIGGLANFPAYVGFTAATGSMTNYHLIDALLVEGTICEP